MASPFGNRVLFRQGRWSGTRFEPIFNGKTLDGWKGRDMSFWSIEDGVITGTISPEHAPKMNQYLVWQNGKLGDFELKLKFRPTGSQKPGTNGGFQFRSRLLPDGDVAGYQVDIDPQQQDLSGILALQLHTGPPMKAQF